MAVSIIQIIAILQDNFFEINRFDIRIDIEHSMIDRRRGMLRRSIVCQWSLRVCRLIGCETPSSNLTKCSSVHSNEEDEFFLRAVKFNRTHDNLHIDQIDNLLFRFPVMVKYSREPVNPAKGMSQFLRVVNFVL